MISVSHLAYGTEHNNPPPTEHKKAELQPQEVFLSFTYQNLFNKVIIAQYENDQFYLPVSEILTALKIPHEVNVSPPTIRGSYLRSENQFVLDFSEFTVSLDSKREFEFSASEMYVGELDYYVKPEILEQAFDLSFSIDFNNLLLKLETPHELPVVSEFNRAQARQEQRRFSLQRDHYPLQFGRDRKLFTGGFLDYSLTANATDGQNFYSYNFSLGTEILGGDLQGGAFGSIAGNTTNFVTDNLRWRYVLRDNKFLSQLYLGQTTADGIESRNFVGIRATNDPIEPRYIFEEFEIEGEARPGSEVELYFDDALYDFQEIDQNGRYRFLAPLTYGSSRLRVKIYDPSGGVRERARRIQVPFNFLKSGELNYHLNAGQLQNPLLGSTQDSYLVQGDVGYGISNWLTQEVGVEYLSEFTDQTPQFFSSTSARIFKEYLLNMDIAPNAFYRVSGSAIYPSSASWDLEYTYFTESDNVYNALGNDHEISGNLYVPLPIFNAPISLRLFGNHTIRGGTSRTRYNADLNTRINRLNIRVSYRDTEIGGFDFAPSIESELNSSVTYFLGRSPGMPGFLRGLFLRGQVDYNPNIGELIQAEAQISRDIFQNGRFQASYSRNFVGDFNLISFGVTIDFKGTRSSSTFRNSRSGTSFSQNLLGSVGYDQYGKDLILSNRQQVGRAASSVRLFVDNNNNGTFDENDEPIRDNAVRIGRSGVTNMGNNGIVRLSQLQAYNQINMEINKSAIKNPMLIPEMEQFSFVTDPNQYKPIEIPFYMSGIISGTVTRTIDREAEPVAGLRVYLESDSTSYYKELRTFNDGSFYAYEVPPGTYNLYIDDQQLEFLEVTADPDTMQISVQPTAQGDFVEGLSFSLTPESAPGEETTTTSATAAPDTGRYQVQIASFEFYDNAVRAVDMAESRFNRTFGIKYNPRRNLYAVRTLPITGQRAAIQQLLTIQNSRFDLPALVVLDSEQKITDNGDNTFSVQIGAFSTRTRAERFIGISNRHLDLELSFVFDPEDNLYKVRTTSFENRKEAEIELKKIRDKTLFGDAFIPPDAPVIYDGTDFAYQVRIEGVSAQAEQAYLTQITGEQGVSDAVINAGPQTDVVLFDDISTWQKAIEVREKLSQISTMGKPVILLIEKD